MARIRTIKPDFFTSDTVSALPLRARLTWIGLWTHCDDYGRCRDNVKLVKAAVWPLDDISLCDVASDLDALAEAGVIFRYVSNDGRPYLQVTNWGEHQKVDRPSRSNLPAPPTNGSAPAAELPGTSVPSKGAAEPRGTATSDPPPDDTRETLASPREDTSNPRAGKGKERKGKEGLRARASPPPTNGTPAPGPEPPPTCDEHRDNPSPPPCGRCADARRHHDQWQTDRRRRLAAAPVCRRHRGQLAHNCALCRAERLGGQP